LHGKKLKGSWVLVRTRGFGSSTKTSWLLIKHRDEFTSNEEVAEEMPRSAISNRLLADIARDGGGDPEKAATGDPKPQTGLKNPVKPRPATVKATPKSAARKSVAKSPVATKKRRRKASD
jgi:bifunctional non-homologous end joining protein LigD